ncbi:MAG: DnaJ-like cysteine-rich domain-containing protein [Planctomycetota bacterium]|jgi:hypothetical protein
MMILTFNKLRNVFSVILIGAVFLVSGCGNLLPFSGPGKGSKLGIRAESMSRYLKTLHLDTAYIRSGAVGQIRKGKVFRERVKDQKGRWSLTTVWADTSQANMIYIQTMRTATCPDCNGTGTRKVEVNLSVDFRCRRCKGAGKIEDHIEQRRFIVSAEDLEDGGAFKATPFSRSERSTPIPESRLSHDEEKYVTMLASKDAEERLQALRWLDSHYVSINVFFHRILPMLRKATWIENDEKRNVTLYQFKGAIETHPDKAYYRIFVNRKSGKVIKKMFVKKENLLRNPYSDHSKTTDGIQEKARKARKWVTDGWDDVLK